MEHISVRARNNLATPIRLTIAKMSWGGSDQEILITVGKESDSLKDYFRTCMDADLPDDQEWVEIGYLNIETQSKISIEGKEVKHDQ